MNVESGKRVTWREWSGQVCTGQVVCHSTDSHGNRTGYVEIRVDPEHYHAACKGSYEMNSGTVCRDIAMHDIQEQIASFQNTL